MKLIIAEKPSVAQAIAKVLNVTDKKDGYIQGNGYIVSWCVGHLVGLAEPESYGDMYKKWDCLPIIPNQWNYAIKESTSKQFNVLRKLMADSSIDSLVCATDAGREGELIFRHVYRMANCKKPFERLWISSLEDSAILQGFKNLKNGRDYDSLYYAALCRERADWLVGINATRLFTTLYNADKVLSIGRVQTPTLAMIVQRDKDISSFKKEKYFKVNISCADFGGIFRASSDKITNYSVAESIKNNCQTAVVISVKKEEKKNNPPKLYDLTTLQRDSNRLYGFTAQQTLEAVQRLYDNKLSTYPRTDSQYLTEDMENTARSIINIIADKMDFAKDLNLNPNIAPVMNNKKVTDHHAIIPTANIETADLSSLTDTDRKTLYLIASRLLSATADKYIYESTNITLKCANTDFYANGKTVVQKGFKDVEEKFNNFMKCKENEEKETEATLPDIKEGQQFPVEADISEHYTQPPKPYTEDTLLSAMERAGNEDYETDDVERKGLGTPATRAGIIETLIKRDYIQRNKKQLISTEKGQRLVGIVPEKILSAKLTADWENRLTKISKSTDNAGSFMNDIKTFVTDFVNETQPDNNIKSSFERKVESIGKCPKCGKEVQKGKYGFYCTGKCGMNVAKVYGKELTEQQLQKLLSGKEISYTANSKKTIVLPEVIQNDYNGKTYFQWKTKKG